MVESKIKKNIPMLFIATATSLLGLVEYWHWFMPILFFLSLTIFIAVYRIPVFFHIDAVLLLFLSQIFLFTALLSGGEYFATKESVFFFYIEPYLLGPEGGDE